MYVQQIWELKNILSKSFNALKIDQLESLVPTKSQILSRLLIIANLLGLLLSSLDSYATCHPPVTVSELKTKDKSEKVEPRSIFWGRLSLSNPVLHLTSNFLPLDALYLTFETVIRTWGAKVRQCLSYFLYCGDFLFHNWYLISHKIGFGYL